MMSVEGQQKYLEVAKVLNRDKECSFCSYPMTVKGSLKSWYYYFLDYMSNGSNPCSVCSGTACFEGEVIRANFLPTCLYEFLYSSAGNNLKDTAVKFSHDGSKVTAI